MKITHWHDQILDFLIDKRKENPELKFWLRQTNKHNRLERGFWFQGNDDQYISIGFTKAVSGNMSTKSISFVIHFDQGEVSENKIELLFKNNPPMKVQECYKRIADEIGTFQQSSQLHYTSMFNSTDVFANLEKFTTTILPRINDVIKEMGFEKDLLITDQQFNKTLTKTINIRQLNKMKEHKENTDFFTYEEFELLNKTNRKKYIKSRDADIYSKLQHAYTKVEYWGNRILQDLSVDSKLNIVKRPTNQANFFDGYLWAKIYPTEADAKNKWLAITIGLDHDFFYTIKIDTVGLNREDPKRKDYVLRRGNYQNSKIVKRWSDDVFSNWEELLEQSKIDINELLPIYRNMMGEKQNYRGIQTNNLCLNTILYGPPGTGKTYKTITKALSIIDKKDINEFDPSERETHLKDYRKYVDDGQIVFTTFHQSLSYEDFIEGIKPNEPDKGETGISYSVQDGIFKKLCSSASTPNSTDFNEAYKNMIVSIGEGKLDLKTTTGKTFEVEVNRNNNLRLFTGGNDKPQGTLTKENIQSYMTGLDPDISWKGYFDGVAEHLKDEYGYSANDSRRESKEFVLIIDEINRGNVSAIFGELITLLETDKRIGNKEALHVDLPYSKKKFGVPNNLHVIGTMNTADRSVEALDSALRRRFEFEEVAPNPSLIAQVGPLNQFDGILEEIDVVQLLSIINGRIEKLIDKDHMIGHSYFLNISEMKDLKLAFQNKIIPLLQEYFFGDYGKIGLVLGQGFFENNDALATAKFAAFKDYETRGLEERPVYRLKNVSEMNLDEFKEAVETLMTVS